MILVWSGRWVRADTGLPLRGAYRVALRIGDTTYLAGDAGALVRLAPGAGPAVVPLGTTCTLRGLFAVAGRVWVVGSDGDRGAVWRLGPDGAMHWGECP